MKPNHEELYKRLSSLKENFSNLSQRLEQTRQGLEASGAPPAEDFIAALSASRNEFVDLRDSVLAQTESLPPSSLPKPDEIISLKNLESLLQAVTETERKKVMMEEVRQRALEALDRVLMLVHCDGIDFSPLSECQAKARELRRAISDLQWPDLPPDLEALAENKHPFAELLRFVEKGDELDNDSWGLLHDVVAQAFGKPLAVAVSRRKLIIPTGSPQKPPKPVTTAVEDAFPDLTAQPQSVNKPRAKTPSTKINSQTVVDTVAQSQTDIRPPALTTATVEEPTVAAKNLPTDLPLVEDLSEALSEPTIIETPVAEKEARIETLQLQTKYEPVKEAPTPKIETKNDEHPPEQAIRQEDKPLCHFSSNDTAQKIAAFILNAPRTDRAEGLRDLVWRLILDDKLGLAFHVTRCLGGLHPDLWPRVPSWLVRSVALSRHVRHENGELARILKDDFSKFNDNCFAAGKPEWNYAIRFLLAAAALRPALLAPNSDASAILHSLRREGINQLFEYCQVIANNFHALDLNALKKVRSQAAWQADLDSLRQEVADWRSQASQMMMAFAPATFVWRKWQETNGVVYSLLHYIQQNDFQQLEAAQKDIKRWLDDGEIRNEVNYTDRKVLGRRIGADITARALGQICRRLREAVGFVRRWIDLQESRPGQTKGYRQAQAEKLRQEVWSRHEAVLKELDSFERRYSSLFAVSAISCCRRALENIRILFDPDAPLPLEEPDPRHLLHAELLKTPIPMDDQWEPVVPDQGLIIDRILDLIALNRFDWRQAFQTRNDLRDHEGTKQIIEYLESNDDGSIKLDELGHTREKHIRECQAALQQAVDATRKKIEVAVAFGLLGESERSNHNAVLESIAMTIPETLRFFEKHNQLKSISDAIDAKRKAEVENVKQRLESVHIAPEHSIYGRISSALEKGDVLTANEYIDIVLAGQTIPESADERDAFRDFFPDKAREIDYFLERVSPQAVIRKIQDREGFCGIDMQRVPGAQADEAAEMLEAWYTAKKAKKIDEVGAHKILANLGFSVLQIAVDRSRTRLWMNVTTEPIQDRKRCPVAIYGSGAYGKYRVLCVWGRPNEEDLVNDVGDTSMGSPVMVFHFGRMTEQRRRDLARLCRERRRTFIVIDETLLLYLCGERGSRLPILFKCALPFTFLEPYTTTASLVPPEMFYGRQRERDSIIDPMGSCFIYGGRQLGKTALLRDVERTFHKPQQGRLALWLDLKAEDIGYQRSIDSIWELLAKEFKKLQILPEKLPPNTGVDRILELIQSWLEEDTQRRILLLLDEADKFLDSDGKEDFIRSTRLKGLMDKANRRFKAVFAGLHNVQRTTKQSNHPLAHYGTPLCIGPLIKNGEAHEARALIEHPLMSLGYRFESPDLAILVLSQTNYYPSLIQLYCNQLLRHVTEPHVAMFDPKKSPPFIISAQHVEEAYRSRELRDSIKQRFNLTLQLDQKYEFIADFIAYHCLADDRKGLVEGFSWSWIREQALSWWPDGFRDSASSKDSIVALLDEMVGLGVLRTVGSDRYALRSTNVISLIGTKDEIEAELLTSREAPLEYEPATFRSAYRIGDNPDDVDHSRRSPLTAQQESELRDRKHGVSIIFGCDAAGLGELGKFALSAFGKEYVTFIGGIPDIVGFKQHLADLGDRTPDGTNLVFVTTTCPWDEIWIEEAVQKIQKLTSKTSFVRIVFVANPQTVWQLASLHPAQFDTLTSKGVTTFSLKPWDDAALRQWLEDCGFESDKETRETITKSTGNWPILLQSFYERSKGDPHRWKHDLQELDKSLNAQDMVRKLVVSFGLDCQKPFDILRDVAALGEASAEDLAAITENASSELVTQSLKWADMLRLVIPTGNGRWRVNPLVGRVIESIGA